MSTTSCYFGPAANLSSVSYKTFVSVAAAAAAVGGGDADVGQTVEKTYEGHRSEVKTD